jgi:hypothetical protein
MCGACGSAGGTRDADARGVEDSPAARKRAQLALASWGSRLFAPDHIRVREAPGTVRVLVVGPTGQGVLAQGADGVLDAVDRVGARTTDWTVVAERLRASRPGDDPDWAYRSLASAVARRRDPAQ